MKNKKLLTALVSIIMGGTAIGGGVSLTACKSNDNGGDNTPAHTWSTTEYGKDDVNHWHVCTDDGCDLIYQVTPHDFTNGDCVCGQPKPSSGKPDDGSGDKDDDKDKAGLVSITAYDHTQNGSRVTQRLQKLFKVGDTFNTTNLVVEATSKVDGQDKVETLKLSDLEIEKPDMTTAGEKTVVIKYGGKETSYTINVIDLSGVSKNEATVTVNQTATIGATGNVVTVNGINDAVQVFKLLGTDDNTTKTINITAGTYHEKVEFDIPNLHVIGADADATKTVIEYDLLAAYICPGAGKAYSTDGSATVSVRAAAIGFHAENITFQNYYNTHERYLQSKEIADKLDGNTMAVACLVQADQCVFDNVRFSSYHDTLYDHNGRHVYNDCFIEGRTDYVFGYGATSLFNNCTLNTIGANDAKNGGYVCATRGFVKHVNDWTTADTVIDYGYIFNGCTFTNDSNVQDGTVSLARAWSGHMTLAFIECNMSKAYAKTAYGSTTDNKNKRYGSMSQGDPNPERLYEYGNTGEGALDYTTLGAGKVDNLCTVLTETEKDTFLDKSVIFAAKNGQYEYSSAWNGEAGVIVPVTYNFAFGEQAKNWVDTNGEYADLIDGISVNGKYKLNGNSIQFSVGTVIKMKLAGKISVDWFGTNWGTANNGIITYKNGCATLTIVADKTGGTDGQNGVYIKNIVLDGTQIQEDTKYTVTFDSMDGSAVDPQSVVIGGLAEEPTAPTKGTDIFGGWYKDEDCLVAFDFETETITSDITLYAKWNPVGVVDCDVNIYVHGVESSIGKLVIQSGKTVTAADVNKLLAATAGYENIGVRKLYTDSALTTEYTEAISGETDIYITYQYVKSTNIDLLDFTETWQSGTGGIYKGIEVDTSASGAKFGNLNNNWLQFNKDTVLKVYVTPEADVLVSADILNNTVTIGYENIADGYVTITADSNGYIRAVTVGFVKKITESGTYYTHSTDLAKSNDYVLIDNCTDNSGSNMVITKGTVTLNVDAGAIITVTSGYVQAESWGLFTATENGVALTPVNDTAKKTSTFTATNGGIIVISAEIMTKEDGTTKQQSCITGISVAFGIKEITENITIDLTDNPTQYQGNTGMYKNVDIDATNGKLGVGNGTWTQMNSGTVLTIKVAEGATVTAVMYDSNYTISERNEETGEVKITATANTYIKSINVSFN